MRLRVAFRVLLVALATARMLTAQDGDLDPLLRLRSDEGLEDVSSRSIQAHRIPVSWSLVSGEERRWGLRLTAPVSFGVYELQAATSVGDLLERVDAVTVTPGVELQRRLGEHWLIKPFGEVGVTADTRGGGAELLYGAGVRSLGTFARPALQIQLGGSVSYRSARSRASILQDFTSVEVGADLQVPLGFEMGSRQTWGGVYAMTRYFPSIEVETDSGADPLNLAFVYEVGVSFATDPILFVWKVKLPWIGIGYRFGDVFSGVRLNFSFPF